jgi:hypothetical protein
MYYLTISKLNVVLTPKHGRSNQLDGQGSNYYDAAVQVRAAVDRASYLSYRSYFSMRSWIGILQNHVMATSYYFIIMDNNCTKWSSITAVNSSVRFFNCL